MKQRETLIRKIIPVELFDMAGLEHWLSDMAAQGLHLVKLNHDTARFRRGEPVPGVRFGLEITGVSDIDRERNAAYQEAGWTYVTTLRNLYYVYRTERVDAPPLHTDPALQSQQWNKLYRSARRSFVRDVFLLVLAAVLTALLLEDTPILHLLTTSAVPLILYGLYQLCSLPAAWAEVQASWSRLVQPPGGGRSPWTIGAPYPGQGGSFPHAVLRAVCASDRPAGPSPLYCPSWGRAEGPSAKCRTSLPSLWRRWRGRATALMKWRIPTNRTTSITAEGTTICCAGTSGRYFRPDRRTWPES